MRSTRFEARGPRRIHQHNYYDQNVKPIILMKFMEYSALVRLRGLRLSPWNIYEEYILRASQGALCADPLENQFFHIFRYVQRVFLLKSFQISIDYIRSVILKGLYAQTLEYYTIYIFSDILEGLWSQFLRISWNIKKMIILIGLLRCLS